MRGLLFGALGLAGLASAQEPELQAAPADAVETVEAGKALTVAVTASGGGSLGAYEAGLLYYLSEIAKENPQRWNVKVLTGTSAGGINTFVMTLSLCGPVDVDPRESPFFRTWIPIGFDTLFDPETTVADGVLDRKGFDPVIEGLRGRFEGGLRAGCSLDWAVATARLRPRYVPLTHGFSTPIGEEDMVFHVEGVEGKPPVVTARVIPGVGFDLPVMPVSDPAADVFGLMRDAAFATSSFPVAFRPVVLPTCFVGEEADPTTCTLATAETHRYLDGGLYDNAPIRLAHRIADANGDGAATVHIYIDAYLGRFPGPPRPDPESAEIERTTQLISMMAGGVLAVSQQRSLVTLLEEDPEVLDRVSVTTAYSPQFSRELFGFFGLFQKEVREYDFWLGVYSAWRELRDRSPMFRMAELVLPQDVPGATAEAWAPFRCLEATYEGLDPAACALPEAQRLAPLIQVGIERLYAWCKATPESTISGMSSEHCEAARAGEPPPRVAGANEPGPDWAMRPDESPLNHALRRLAWHGFVFSDLGQTVPSEEKSRKAIRGTLHDMVGRLAAANGGQQIVIGIVGNTMVDSMVPAPKRSKPQ